MMGQGARRKEDQSSQKEHVHRYFWEVVDVDQSHLYECKTIQGTHALHLVKTSDNAIVECGQGNSLLFVIHVTMVNGTIVNP